MEPRYVCPRCKSTFLDSRIRTNSQGIVECPVCGSMSFYGDDTPEGLKLLADTIVYESSAREVCLEIERNIRNLYHVNSNMGWDEVLGYFKDCYPINSDKSVSYRVGFNSAVNVRLILIVGQWEVTLAINAENRVYIHSMYRKPF